MPNGALTNFAEHIAKTNVGTFSQKTFNQGTGGTDVSKVLIQN